MEEKELKRELEREFELERVILFSDAVFAIIITIMVLDVKLPDGMRTASEHDIKHAFKELIIKFLAYFMSFFLVSSFWIKHLRTFKTLKDYDTPLVARNLIFLFVISMFPFAVSTITSGVSINTYWCVDIYLGIILCGIFSQTFIVHYIVKHKHKLCFSPDKVEDALKWKLTRLNYFMIPMVLVLVVVLNIVNANPLIVAYSLVPYALAFRVISKKYYPGKEDIKVIIMNKVRLVFKKRKREKISA